VLSSAQQNCPFLCFVTCMATPPPLRANRSFIAVKADTVAFPIQIIPDKIALLQQNHQSPR
jgi:hypothetical protein